MLGIYRIKSTRIFLLMRAAAPTTKPFAASEPAKASAPDITMAPMAWLPAHVSDQIAALELAARAVGSFKIEAARVIRSRAGPATTLPSTARAAHTGAFTVE